MIVTTDMANSVYFPIKYNKIKLWGKERPSYIGLSYIKRHNHTILS